MGSVALGFNRGEAARRWRRFSDRLFHVAPRVPLALKLAGPVVVTTALLATALGTIVISQVRAQIAVAYDQQTEAIAAGVDAMFLQHPEDTQEINDYLGRLQATRPDVVSIRIHGLDAQGIVIASSNPKEVGMTGLADSAELRAVWAGTPTVLDRNQTLVTIYPLRDQDFSFGAVVVTSRRSSEMAAVNALTFDIGVAAAAAIAVELVFVLATLYFAILRRTRRLQRAVAAVERGDTSVRLPEGQEPPGRDEIFNLARRVDRMISSIDERQHHDALIRGLSRRALEGTPAPRLVVEGLQATREALGLDRCIFATVSERGSVVSSIDDAGVSSPHHGVPVWVGALAAVAVGARKPVLTDRMGQASRFAESVQDFAAQALIVPLPRKSKAGEAIIAIAQSGETIHAGGLAAIEAVAATISEALHMQEAEEARAESAVKSRVMAAVSHEMRNPLNSILGFTALVLGSKDPLSDKQRRQLGYVQSSATNMLNLVNNYLDLAKSRSGSLQIQPENVNLASVVDETVGMMQPIATAKSVTIRSAVHAQSSVRVDQTRLRQVLTNLISNAVKFTPEGGRVYVRARSDARACRLVVSDTGVGIAREDRALVFSEFAKIDAGPLSSGKGTGLGLALTRAIVEAMGGTVKFYSRRGRGTTFVVVLPLTGGAQEKPAA